MSEKETININDAYRGYRDNVGIGGINKAMKRKRQ
jgi:hypothetical protein